MSATETTTVTLEIDGREVVVPKGTPLVLAAAAHGIEIPIFCYEPRLGAPVGACRMCLVEIEGMPKLQAACTMTATDGMKVHSKSGKALGGQKAVLEFLLLNHPLDCPVCDKGGECPLQDLTFRYGPGDTRYKLAKRTYDKPIAVSPLIALDRERCILCYRCTRFSQEVSEDEQLIARERSSGTVIATFEERPYRGHFSGNVVELCPVGALTATTYRFRARPWEIVNVPTVCGLCPTGCNTWATVREGRVERVLSRNLPELDEGWLCDKGRFALGHLHAADRRTVPLARGPQGLAPTTYADAAEQVALRMRHHATLHGPEAVAIVASGEQTSEEAFGWATLAAAAGGATLVGPDPADAQAALQACAAQVADIDRADLIVVAGDRDVADALGIVDLRVRRAAGAGARLVLVSAGAGLLDRHAGERIPAPPGSLSAGFPARVQELLAAAARPVLIVTDPVPPAAIAALAGAAGLATKPGGVLVTPAAPNAVGVRRAGFDADAGDLLARAEAGKVRVLVLLGDADPVTRWPDGARWRAAIERVEQVIVCSQFATAADGRAQLVLPATAALEKEGTYANVEGRSQRLRPALEPPPGVAPEIELLALAASLVGGDLAPSAGAVHRAMVTTCAGFAGESWDAIGRRDSMEPRLPAPGGAAPPAPALPSPSRAAAPAGATAPAPGPLRAALYRPMFAGPAVERSEYLAFQQPREIVLARADAQRLGITAGQELTVRTGGIEVRGPARVSRALDAGAVRVPYDGPSLSGPCTVEVTGA